MNKIILEGIATNDAVKAPTKNGGVWLRGNIKVEDGKNNLFLNFKCFNDYAEIEIKKDEKIKIEGKLVFEKYKDKNGNEKTAYSVICETIAKSEVNQLIAESAEEKPQF